jgi:hypothetical protein
MLAIASYAATAARQSESLPNMRLLSSNWRGPAVTITCRSEAVAAASSPSYIGIGAMIDGKSVALARGG